MAKNIYKQISNLGIDFTVDRSEAKRISLSNQLQFVSVLLTFLFCFIYFQFGIPQAIVIEIFAIIGYSSCLIFSAFRRFSTSRLVFIIIMNLQVFLLAMSFGNASQVQLFFIPVAVVPVVLFGVQYRKTIAACLMFSFTLFVCTFFIDSFDSLKITTATQLLSQIHLMFNISAFVCEVIVIYAFVYSYSESEKDLNENNDILQLQLESVFNNSYDALFLSSDAHKIVRANKRAVELFEMEQESCFLLFSGLDLHDTYPTPEEIKEIFTSIESKGLYENEILYKTYKGNTFWGSVVVRPLTIKNKRYHSVRVTDITQSKKINQYTQDALREKEILLAEIHHRVKNNLSVINGLLGLHISSTENKEAHRVIEDCRNRVHSMALIHNKLYQNTDFSKIDFSEHINELVYYIKNTYHKESFDIEIENKCTSTFLNIKQAVPCSFILNEILTNVFKHAFKGLNSGIIKIACSNQNNLFVLEMCDNGIGFDKAKLSAQNTSIGFTLIDALVEQINGVLIYENNNGTCYKLSFETKQQEAFDSAKLF